MRTVVLALLWRLGSCPLGRFSHVVNVEAFGSRADLRRAQAVTLEALARAASPCVRP